MLSGDNPKTLQGAIVVSCFEGFREKVSRAGIKFEKEKHQGEVFQLWEARALPEGVQSSQEARKQTRAPAPSVGTGRSPKPQEVAKTTWVVTSLMGGMYVNCSLGGRSLRNGS